MIKINKILYIIALLTFGCDLESSTQPEEENSPYNTEISIHKENDLIYVLIYDYPEIAGFQFDLDKNENLEINSLDAFGGVSETSNFTVSEALNNLRILGFSLTGDKIESNPMNSDTLLYINVSSNGTGSLGLDNVILSGENGVNLPVQVNSALISIP